MSINTILLAIYFKWLGLRKKLIKIIPVSAKTKSGWLNKLKLKQNTVKSRLQQLTVSELFGPHAKGIVFDTRNGILVNSFNDVQVNRYLGNTGEYNFDELDILLPFITSASTVYIVGTHIGALLIPVAKKAATVAGFEANPLTFDLLKLNIAVNSLSNTRAYNYAIYNAKTTLSFYQNKVNSGGSKIKPLVDSFNYTYDKPTVINVEGDTLDNLRTQCQLPLPDLIIMDIEGAEYFALQGASTCLANAQVLYIEFVPHHLKNVSNTTVGEFSALLTKYFSSMKLIGEEIKKENKSYSGGAILQKLQELYDSEISADLLLFKPL